MAERCEYACRKRGDLSVHCQLVDEKYGGLCGKQFLCPNTKRWEVNTASPCLLKQRAKGER